MLWLLLVCYPNPFIFFRNFARYVRFPIDPAIIRDIKKPIPDEPSQIEKLVYRLVPYEFDWNTYGVPWMMPTPREVLQAGKGDCESRAVVLASLLHAKGIPYDIKASFTHLWVDYPRKKPNRAENDDIAYIGKRQGKLFLKPPTLHQWGEQFAMQKEALWEKMPPLRKLLLLGGWAALGVWTMRRKGKLAR
ncbi:MAG: transglutaminase domain-containing protein [Abditibacteriales bacterium]|nr:transglutaminase domain-containing protein [Abditibacteriales bacterium]